MNKEILQELIDKGLSQYSIAREMSCSQTTVRYWLKKHNLKTFVKPLIDENGNRFCNRCKEIKHFTEFYNRNNVEGSSSYCKSCTKEEAINRQKRFKQDCIDYKGGSCKLCGYNRCNSALEFHHLDPSKKDLTISKVSVTSINDEIRKELDKCVLLCSNCHREVHAGIQNI